MAEFKLNLYERGKVIKTLTTDSYEMSFGVFEDMMGFMDFAGSKEDAKSVMRFLKPLMLEIFTDATEEDIRKARRSDVMALMHSVIAYGVSEMGTGGEKNQAGAQT